MAIDTEEGREYIDRLGNAADAAKEAGDEAGVSAAHEALRRIGDGDRPEVVFLESNVACAAPSASGSSSTTWIPSFRR